MLLWLDTQSCQSAFLCMERTHEERKKIRCQNQIIVTSIKAPTKQQVEHLVLTVKSAYVNLPLVIVKKKKNMVSFFPYLVSYFCLSELIFSIKDSRSTICHTSCPINICRWLYHSVIATQLKTLTSQRCVMFPSQSDSNPSVESVPLWGVTHHMIRQHACGSCHR